MTTTEIALQEFLGTPLAQAMTAQMGGEYAARIAWLAGAAHFSSQARALLVVRDEFWPALDAIEGEFDIIEKMLEEVFDEA